VEQVQLERMVNGLSKDITDRDNQVTEEVVSRVNQENKHQHEQRQNYSHIAQPFHTFFNRQHSTQSINISVATIT
jgi:hypothetical protein